MKTESVKLFNYSFIENRKNLSGLLMIIIGAGFLTVMMLSAAIAENYDFKTSAISDLGIYASTKLLFNTGLILVGIVNLTVGYLLYIEYQKKGLLAVYVIAGIGAIGTGLFPLDQGDIHSLFALTSFVFFNIQVILSQKIAENMIMRVISIILGIIGFIFVVVMFIGDSDNSAIFGAIGHGGAERMIVYPPMIGLIIIGGYLLGQNSSSSTGYR